MGEIKLSTKDEVVKKRIIVIDDDITMGKLIQKHLESEFDVIFLDNATDAISECEANPPEIILVDINMPNIDGFEFLNLVQSHSVMCDIPVIAMTSNTSEDYSHRVHDEGAAGLIHKPFDIKTLGRDIEGILHCVDNQLTSKNGRVNFIIEFNELRRQKEINKLIAPERLEEAPVVVLSWSRGEDFFYEIPELEEYVYLNKIIFLEIKPSLISKFPYIQDITPIMQGIQQFLGRKSREYHLIMEEPRHILNIHNREKSVSQAYYLGQSLHSDFDKITYINSRPHDEDARKFLNKIGRILTGVQSNR